MNDARYLAGLITTLALGAWGPAHADAVTEWNAVTLKCVQGAPGIPANRLGPPGLMDIALVQAAVHDAVQAIQGRFEPYQYDNAAMGGVGSPQAAAAAAAHGVLVGLYGADDPCLATAANPAATYPGDAGLQGGAQAAAAVLPLYRPTMVLPTDPFVGSTEIGQWRPTPGVTQAANTFMAVTAPFALKEPEQFRPQPPMPLTSERYARDYDEVKALGAVSSTTRTPAQTDLARFWSVNFFSQWYEAVRGIAETAPELPDALLRRGQARRPALVDRVLHGQDRVDRTRLGATDVSGALRALERAGRVVRQRGMFWPV